MMSKWYKKITLPLVILFAVPIISLFCCCTEQAAAEDTPHAHEHVLAENLQHDHQANHRHCSTSSHNHSECSHPQVIADLAGKVTSFLTFQNSGFKIPEKDFPAHQTIDLSPKADSFPPTGEGPPGQLLTNTPLYLQISVLRI